MKYFGGETEVEDNKTDSYFTHSARASTRLFCRNFPDKKILIPDFLCYIVVEVLEEENMNFDYYHVDEDLKIDLESIKGKEYDVLYTINYFGQKHDNLKDFNFDDIILFQDNVFDANVHNEFNARHWFAFNSFRKPIELSDGSLARTNLKIENLVTNQEAEFVEEKYKAKDMKYKFLYQDIGSQDEHVKQFSTAEKILDDEKDICAMSNHSLGLLMDFWENYPHEQQRRKENYEFLYKNLESIAIKLESDFYSFFIIKVDDRDEFKKYLFSKSIYLPSHWTYFGKVENSLYDKVVSIPVFSKYSLDDLGYVVEHIKAFLDKKS